MGKTGNALKFVSALFAAEAAAMLLNAMMPAKAEAQYNPYGRRLQSVAGAQRRPFGMPLHVIHPRTFISTNFSFGYNAFPSYGFYPFGYAQRPMFVYPPRIMFCNPAHNTPAANRRTLSEADQRAVYDSDDANSKPAPGAGPEPENGKKGIEVRYSREVASNQVDDVLIEFLDDVFQGLGKEYRAYDMGNNKIAIKDGENNVVYRIDMKDYSGKLAREIVGNATREMVSAGLVNYEELSDFKIDFRKYSAF